MIAALIASGLLAAGGVALWATFYFAPARHAGAGEGALTVAQLLAQAEAGAATGGRHRLREPVVMRGDLADALAVEETRLLPAVEAGLPFDDVEYMATHPWTLRHVYAGLQRL